MALKINLEGHNRPTIKARDMEPGKLYSLASYPSTVYFGIHDNLGARAVSLRGTGFVYDNDKSDFIEVDGVLTISPKE